MAVSLQGWNPPRRGPVRLDGDAAHPRVILARLRAVVARMRSGHRLVTVPTTSQSCVALVSAWAEASGASAWVQPQAGGWEVSLALLPDELGGLSVPTRYERLSAAPPRR